LKVPFFTPWITDSDKKSVLKVLNQRWLTDGPILKKFENRFSKFIGSKYSVGCLSATHALHLSLKSLGIVDKKTEQKVTDLKKLTQMILEKFPIEATSETE